MVTFVEYILIIGFKNGCFSINPFPKDRRYFAFRYLEGMEESGIVGVDISNDFSLIMTEKGKTITRFATERIGDEVVSRLKITDIYSSPFAKYHLYPDPPE